MRVPSAAVTVRFREVARFSLAGLVTRSSPRRFVNEEEQVTSLRTSAREARLALGAIKKPGRGWGGGLKFSFTLFQFSDYRFSFSQC